MARRLLTLLAALLLALGLGQSSASAASFTNPVKSVKGADPWISYHDGNYYLVTTSWTDVITMRRSPTLGGLDTAPSIQVWKGDAASRCCNIWAPELHYGDGHWYLYYVAGQNITDYNPTQRVHVLESTGSDPLGPYTYKSQLSGSWMLDPTVATINGKLYVLGSASGGGTQNLVIAPMSNPYTVSGSYTTISTPTYSWEKSGAAVNEGPEILQHGGKTYLIYSASGCWTPDYALGQLTLAGSDPTAASSWTKKSTAVFSSSAAKGVYGPGHNGFFNSPDGQQSWIVYHANDAASDGCDNGRTTRAQGFGWNADGSPNLGTPNALGSSTAGPSGEPSSTPTTYTLTNRASGKCLEVAGSSSADGANVQQYACDGGGNQRWRIQDQGDDTSRLVNVASGKVLDTADCSSADGADLRQWSWLNNTCQRFRFLTTESGGWVRIVNQATGKVADVADCSTADGADVRQWTWLNNNCQQWKLSPA
ncbi:family 43 glycosylhydrolase [Streptomyces sp. SID8379]|uniref:family 43 glycosylhydrolase n=1 Tax=unclassified Streptomyces TaxID=2593676 RepID=UPI0003658C92|nr:MULTISPECIES: family 43 glycosylhydrolase [unclassified Streptomyces]MYW63035.1 family 43 glycosylhydrolase [Streptomyces sp. SID8379]